MSACFAVLHAWCGVQHGKHNDKRSSYGHALIVDPWGR
jgi:hypothetical protein